MYLLEQATICEINIMKLTCELGYGKRQVGDPIQQCSAFSFVLFQVLTTKQHRCRYGVFGTTVRSRSQRDGCYDRQVHN